MPPTPARLSTSYRSPTACCTASRSGVCIGARECTCACPRPRRALGDERLLADVDQVRLAPDAVTLDCDRFAELCERSEWATAAALVDGEFLEGLAIPEANDFETWLAAERALWRAQALEALV